MLRPRLKFTVSQDEGVSMKKNETAIVKIEDIGVNGEGIGKVDGYTLFIKDAVIGDIAEVKVMKAKKNYGYAKLLNILEPSKDRVEAKCPVARQCGGCQIQELSYEKQLEFKEKRCGKFGENWRIFFGIFGFCHGRDLWNGKSVSLSK